MQNAGLFAAIRNSGLFAIDPDFGLEIDNPDALAKYYEVLLAVLRVIAAIVLSRGAQNEATIAAARGFLLENRTTMVGIFKRHARVGALHESKRGVDNDTDAEADLNDLVEFYVLLISLTDFMEVWYTMVFVEQFIVTNYSSTKDHKTSCDHGAEFFHNGLL